MSPVAVAERPTQEPAPYTRPAAGPRLADGGLPCKERYILDQSTPDGHTPCQKCCIVCGRVTARRDDQGMPWCGGELPETKEHQPT